MYWARTALCLSLRRIFENTKALGNMEYDKRCYQLSWIGKLSGHPKKAAVFLKSYIAVVTPNSKL